MFTLTTWRDEGDNVSSFPKRMQTEDLVFANIMASALVDTGAGVTLVEKGAFTGKPRTVFRKEAKRG